MSLPARYHRLAERIRALLGTGSTTVDDLHARLADVSRPALHACLDAMIEREFVVAAGGRICLPHQAPGAAIHKPVTGPSDSPPPAVGEVAVDTEQGAAPTAWAAVIDPIGDGDVEDEVWGHGATSAEAIERAVREVYAAYAVRPDGDVEPGLLDLVVHHPVEGMCIVKVYLPADPVDVDVPAWVPRD